MAMTVRRLAQNGDLGLTFAAGRAHGGRVITWAHPIELADPAPYLSGGELVMTTGMNVGSTHEEQFNYCSRLSAVGVAALAFDTGTLHPCVPQGIIRAGNELGLPVLAVPACTPFIAITRAVIDEVTADQLRAIQRVVDQQQVMARQTFRNGVPGVVTALSRALSATTVVFSTDGDVLAAAGVDVDRVAATWRGSLGEDRGRRQQGSPTRVTADGDHYYMLQALRATQTLRGHLVVQTKGPISPPERVLVSHAVSLVSIELAKPARVLDAERRLRTALTRTLLAAKTPIDGSVLLYFGFAPDDAIAVLILSNTGPALAAEHHAQRVLESRPSPYLLTAEKNELLAIVRADDHAELSVQLRQTLSAKLCRPVGGGISVPCTLQNLALHANQARAAARSARSDEIREFAELRVFGIILGNRSQSELELLAAHLVPLETHDRRFKGAALVDSLATYLSHNAHIENTAASLGIHRHTLRSRLAKIGELLHAELSTADARAELWLALKARELLALGDIKLEKPQEANSREPYS